MILDLLNMKGCPLERQRFTWRDMVQNPISKLDDDAFTRIRVLLVQAIAGDAVRFTQAFTRSVHALRMPLAQIRRIEQHQQTIAVMLLPPDLSVLETSLAHEQAAVEISAAVAQSERDRYLAQVYRFGMLEDFDHLYRFAALLDRLEGKDPNNILQGHNDIVAGRPTAQQHRAPEDDLCEPYGEDAELLSKIHVRMSAAAECQARDYYLGCGSMLADPVARQLYAEISSAEEQHATQYVSLINPDESLLEQWLLHEAMEAWVYASCVEQESNLRLRNYWERFLDYELGQLAAVAELFKQVERRDPASVLNAALTRRLEFRSNRSFIRDVLSRESQLRVRGTQFVPVDQESQATLEYRQGVNAEGSPSDNVAAGYHWSPGSELVRDMNHSH